MQRQELEWVAYVGKPIRTQPTPQFTGRKPSGLWASVGGYWRSWCQYEGYFSGVYTHKFHITFNPSRIITLASAEDVRAFNAEYTVEHQVCHNYGAPNWARVAEKFAGVEVLYPQDLEDHAKWLWGWDLSSLCVWDASQVEIKELDLDWDGSVRRMVYD